MHIDLGFAWTVIPIWLAIAGIIATVAYVIICQFGKAKCFAYDTTTQTITSANTFQNVNFSDNAAINVWTHVPGTDEFICGQPGWYEIHAELQLQKTGGGLIGTNFAMRLLLDGDEIDGSYREMHSVLLVQTVNPLTTHALVYIEKGSVIVVQMAREAITGEIQPRVSALPGATKVSAVLTMTKTDH